MQLIERKNVNKISRYPVFFMLISLTLGEYYKIAGLSLSLICSFFVVLSVIMEIGRNSIYSLPKKQIVFVGTFMLLWGAYACLQILWVGNTSYWIFGIRTLIINIFIVEVLIYHIESLRDIIFYSKALIISLLIQLGIAFWELISKKHLIYFEHPGFEEIPRTVYTNINDCATVIILCCSILLLHWFLTKKQTLLTIMLLILSGYMLIVIGARAILVGAVIILLGSLLLRLCWYISRNNIFRFKILLSIGLIVISACGILALRRFGFINIVSSAGNVKSDELRISLIIDCIKMFENSFGMGAGSGQSLVFLETNPHNLFLEILSEYGFFVFGVLVYMLLSLFNVVFYKNSELKIWTKNYIAAFSVALIPISISSSSINRLRVFWVVLVLMYLTVHLGARNKQITCYNINSISSYNIKKN